MEPASIQQGEKSGRTGSLENPEVHENVPGHVIPIIEREFDDFDTESAKFLRRRDARGGVHRVPPEAGGLRPAPGGRPDDPGQAALRRGDARAAGGLRRRHRALRPAAQGPHHHPAELPVPPCPARRRRQVHPDDLRRRALQPRGVRQHGAQRDRRPVGRRLGGRAVRPDALRGRLRPLLRPPSRDPAHAPQGEDGLHRHRRGPGDHRHPRHRLPPAAARRPARLRAPRGRRHVDHAAGRAHALRVRGRRQRRVPEGRRGRLPDLQSPGLAAQEPGARADQGLRGQVRHRRAAPPGGGGAPGRLGRRARLRPHAAALRPRRGGQRPRAPGRRPQSQRRQPGVRPLRGLQRPPPAPGGLLDRRGQGDARRPDARAAPRPGRGHAPVHRRLRAHQRAPEPRAALGARRGALRRMARAGGARPRRPGRRRDHQRGQLPGHGLLQARDHQLDGAQRRRPAAPGGDGDRG